MRASRKRKDFSCKKSGYLKASACVLCATEVPPMRCTSVRLEGQVWWKPPSCPLLPGFCWHAGWCVCVVSISFLASVFHPVGCRGAAVLVAAPCFWLPDRSEALLDGPFYLQSPSTCCVLHPAVFFFIIHTYLIVYYSFFLKFFSISPLECNIHEVLNSVLFVLCPQHLEQC